MDNDDDDTVVGTCATTCSTIDNKNSNNFVLLFFGFCITIDPMGAITTSLSLLPFVTAWVVDNDDSDDDVEDDDEWIDLGGGDCRSSCAKREFK